MIQNQFPFWKNKGPATEISWNRLAAKDFAQGLKEGHPLQRNLQASRAKRQVPKKNLQLREIKKEEEEEQGEEEAAAAESPRPERRPWSAVKKVLGKDQAYLMGLFGAKWKLIIGCTKKMGQIYPGGHHSVVLDLEKVAMEENMTKEKMTQRKR